MLTVETKRHIDTARQILVGKVPDPKQQIDQITNALIYKFMDDMDIKSADAGGKPSFFREDLEPYAWRKLMDSRKGAQERMNLYTEALVKFSTATQLPQLFRDIFRQAFLPYRDPETLNLFLKEIEYFDYDHSEELGNAFEYLLSIMGAQGDAGQFRTPRHIIDFIVEIIDPGMDDTILDPACGTAGFLISAYKHIVAKHDGKDENSKPNDEKNLTYIQHQKLLENLVGYDISSDMVKLARVNMYLHGNRSPKIYEYDTLSSEERWGDSFDVIMANPPFMSPKGGIRPHNKFSVASSRSEVLFVDYIVSHLKLNGRAGIIVPEGIIFQSGKSYKQLRKNLVEDGLLAVISLPAGVFNPYAGVKTSILIFDNNRAKQSKDILFAKVNYDGFDLGAQRRPINKNDLPVVAEIVKRFRQGEIKAQKQLEDFLETKATFNSTGGFGEAIDAKLIERNKIAETGDYSLTTSVYLVEETNPNQKWPLVKLGEVVEILDKLRRPITKHDRKKGDYPYYGATGILDYVDNYIFNERLVLLGEDGAKWSAGEKTAFIAEGKYWVNNHAHVLRPISSKIIDTYLVNVLNQMNLSPYITGVTVPKLNQEKMKQIQLPLPPIAIQKEIVAEINNYQEIIDGARQVIENYKPTIKIDPTWPTVKLGDKTLFDIQSGGTPNSNEASYWNGDTNWATLVDLPATDFITELAETKRKITREGLAKSSAKLLPIGTVLVSTRATLGRVAIARTETATNQGFKNIIVKDRNKVLPDYVACMCTTLKPRIEGLASGGTFSELSKTAFETLEIPLPSIKDQERVISMIQMEQSLVNANRLIIEAFEQKIREKIAEVWGE